MNVVFERFVYICTFLFMSSSDIPFLFSVTWMQICMRFVYIAHIGFMGGDGGLYAMPT